MSAILPTDIAARPPRQLPLAGPAADLPEEFADFTRTLQERAALTDPAFAGSPTAAPLAVAFDRGDLFGRAVSLAQNPGVPQPTPSRFSGPTGPHMEPIQQSLCDLSGSAPDGGRLGLEPFEPAKMAITRGPHGEAPRAAAASVAKLASQPSIEPIVLAAYRIGLSSGSGQTPVAQIEGAELAQPRQGRRGEQIREAVVAQLRPVNVMVRAAQGMQVAVRIGALLPADEADAERAIAAAVLEEGADLHDLRINGKRQGSGE